MFIPILHSSFQLFPPLGRAHDITNYYFSWIVKSLQPKSDKNFRQNPSGIFGVLHPFISSSRGSGGFGLQIFAPML
ncbi:hypothetical protein [Gemmiger gallinarum]|nr:hypothetical protein [Gemmiger gallinarum]